MIKEYEVGGLVLQFEEGLQPEGAVEVGTAERERAEEEAARKGRRPANKAGNARDK